MSDYEQLNLALRQEISAIAPNRLDDLLARLGAQQSPEAAAPEPAAPAARRNVRSFRRYLVAAVLALVLLGSGAFYGIKSAQRSVVVIDANAPVAFTVNGFDRVTSVRLETADTSAYVDAERCNGKKLDDAIGALTDQLVEAAVISPSENAVLLSVQEDGAKRADRLASEAVDALRSAAARHSLAPVILVQKLPEKAGVGSGRAALVDQMIRNDDETRTDTLLRASVMDLLIYADARHAALSDTTLYGALDRDAYCTPETAVQAACSAASCDAENANAQAVLGWQEAELVYIVTLQKGEQYEFYCISARTGEVLDSFVPEPGQIAPEPTETTSGSAPQGGTANVPSTPSTPAVPDSGYDVPQWDIDTFVDMIEFWDDII